MSCRPVTVAAWLSTTTTTTARPVRGNVPQHPRFGNTSIHSQKGLRVSTPQPHPQPTRRGLLKAAAGVSAGGILGGGIYAARSTAPAATFKPMAASAAALTHPGLLHTQ